MVVLAGKGYHRRRRVALAEVMGKSLGNCTMNHQQRDEEERKLLYLLLNFLNFRFVPISSDNIFVVGGGG